jgi:hypothetical protein
MPMRPSGPKEQPPDGAGCEAGEWLRAPARLWSWKELCSENALPARPGVYGWYFDALPPVVPVADCHRADGWVLAYVGIAPRRPYLDGRRSSQTLASRLRMHFAGRAFGSTLRYSLGCLLSGVLGLEYRRHGQGFGFGLEGETALSRWMHTHARVVYCVHEAPWIEEERSIDSLSVPLNLKGNEGHPFHTHLSALRWSTLERARQLPVLPR